MVSTAVLVRHTTHRVSKELHSTHVWNDIQHHRSKQPGTDGGSITVLVWVVGGYTARTQQWSHVKSASQACSYPVTKGKHRFSASNGKLLTPHSQQAVGLGQAGLLKIGDLCTNLTTEGIA